MLLDGAKGVGKTETALQRASTVRRLDDAAQRSIAAADPDLALRGDPPILIDEWQRHPPMWDAIKRAVDADPAPGRFLLTGSAPRAGDPVHSGAARIVPVRMRPMTLTERGVAQPTVSLAGLLAGGHAPVEGMSALGLSEYVDLLLGSGLPGVQHLTDRPLRAQLDAYVDLIVQRDVVEAGHDVRRPATLRAWLAAYVAATATSASWETIRDAASAGHADKAARTSTIPYVEVLTALRVLDGVPAWLPTDNPFSRLGSAPKRHLLDPALAARLLGVTAERLLDGDAGPIPMVRHGTLLGGLFESLVTLTVRTFAQAAEAKVAHFREWGGRREVDLIVERHDGRVLAIEAKLGRTVTDDDVTHLRWLRDRIPHRIADVAVVHTGPEAYRRPDGVAVIPLALLGA
ncbi:MAG: ATP-binding protein [Euzebya sp.]